MFSAFGNERHIVHPDYTEAPESGITLTSAGSSLVTIIALNRWKRSVPARDHSALHLVPHAQIKTQAVFG